METHTRLWALPLFTRKSESGTASDVFNPGSLGASPSPFLLQVQEVEKLLEILRSAGERRALVVYTLVEPNMSEVARTACNVMQVGLIGTLQNCTQLMCYT